MSGLELAQPRLVPQLLQGSRKNYTTARRQGLPVVASKSSVSEGQSPAEGSAKLASVQCVCALWPREYRTRNGLSQKSTRTISLVELRPYGSPATGCANRSARTQLPDA